ncbi:selenocysteine-specific translation elongation factor [Sulfitobacter sp. M57]|uniref:selenocysteine-specific translation elongation factor n=1 Tax=unclassified Sulfitobacter TaxID=196795 RepID=UPI0023E1AAC8|nr:MULTISPECIES: selenocysteine-specific translation elongation factor [unclassified Sulfitobacter]MDF3413227.1 selenocysteine-specific translation elongation factor [Sulfitobacter sp. KE5]MDF3421490.1 selenocysteine-specific translation elongation factor [Sulfitobacter sp. KE43]MDF3431776.1 selenocysteine-specific translation elongation factor [Sulfitobacter sp. KE42]MDF3457416.1 selenocysteine-specific translation elongation factor [Sulfitobacter sp. S74]MDF3461319.1 selenocysteine-specific 
MNTCCMVVIGHVDHGKTALVQALTGTDTDRLPEEKIRGLSITAGFAHHRYPAGVVDFVDTPGHADFIQAMITGASGAQAALLVISATDGVAAQTLEHLKIAALLGVAQGIIAVTKSDMLSASQLATRVEGIRRDLSQTVFAQAPLVACSVRSDAGISTLHAEIEALLQKCRPTTNAPLQSYLPIDRVFSLSGLGTVVTGTLLGGALNLHDKLWLHPAERPITLRSLQSRGKTRGRIHAGERTAAGLRGLAVADVTRGSVLCAQGAQRATTCIDVRLNLLADITAPLKHMQDLRVFFGTTSHVASLRLFGGGQLGAGHSGFAQLRFKNPVVGYAGQHAVLRRLSPAETVSGAVFLDPQATPTKSREGMRMTVLEAAHRQDIPAIAAALCAANRGVCTITDVARLSRRDPDKLPPEMLPGFVQITAQEMCPREQIDICTKYILAALHTYHAQFPLRHFAAKPSIVPPSVAPVLLQHVESTMIAKGLLHQKDGKLAAFGHDPMANLDNRQRSRMAEIETAFREAGLAASPPQITEESDTDLLVLLADTGAVLVLTNVALKQRLMFHKDALHMAAASLRKSFPAPQFFTTSAARSALHTSRRIIVPVLEYFDETGVTERTGNLRRMRANPVPPPSAQR